MRKDFKRDYFTVTEESLREKIQDVFFDKVPEKRTIQIWCSYQHMKMFDKLMKEEFNKQFPTCDQQYEKQNNEDEELS